MRRRKSRLRALAVVTTAAALLLPILAVEPSAAEKAQPQEPAEAPTAAAAAEPPDIGERPAAERSSAVRYGPYSIDPGPQMPDGRHGHAHSGNQFAMGVQKPCSDCYITGMTADLVDTSGNTVGIRDNLQLHHMVLFNQGDGRTDATCNWGFPFPLGALFGQRFFASGDERTPLVAAPGQGYYVGNGTFNLIWDLASMSQERETVFYQVTYLWIPASEAGEMTNLEPIWFDLDQCGDSQVTTPAGSSTQTWTWTANRTGDIVGIGGHQHNGGVNIEITNDTTGEQVCDSVAGYGETPLYVDHHGEEWVSSFSTCGGAPEPGFASPVNANDRVTIRSHYNMPEATDDQMGIVIAYMTQPSAEECQWWQRWLGLC